MEKLLKLQRDAERSYPLIRKEKKTENSSFIHVPNNDLMELFEQIRKGDTKAIEKLSAQYIHQVINIANDFKGNGLTFLELILKGNEGLIRAAENYNASRGIDFTSYASWSVRQGIIQAIDEKEFNKPLPINKIGLLSKNKYGYQNHNNRTSQLVWNY